MVVYNSEFKKILFLDTCAWIEHFWNDCELYMGRLIAFAPKLSSL